MGIKRLKDINKKIITSHYVFGVGVVELKIIESSIACDYQDYMVTQLNFFWTSLPDALGLYLFIILFCSALPNLPGRGGEPR